MRRKGCSVDENYLSNTFKSLGFHVQVEKNLSANKMIGALRKGTVQYDVIPSILDVLLCLYEFINIVFVLQYLRRTTQTIPALCVY